MRIKYSILTQVICDLQISVRTLEELPTIGNDMMFGNNDKYRTLNKVDFKDPYSVSGEPNRLIEPIIENNVVVSYDVVKREKIKAGVTKIFKVEVPTNQAKPFFQLELPDKNVLVITSVIVLNGLGIDRVPSFTEFNDFNLNYIKQLSQIIDDSGEIGEFELENMLVNIKKLDKKEKTLIVCQKS